MAITVEFWKENGKLFIEHNKRSYDFNDYLKTSDAQFVVDNIYLKILQEYPDEARGSNNKGHTVGNFIKNHFLIKDKIFDVVILENGKTTWFNLEQ